MGNWSVGRDQSCPNNGAYTASNCSGIVQQPYAFAAIFGKLTGHWGAGVTANPGYTGAGTGTSGSTGSGGSSTGSSGTGSTSGSTGSGSVGSGSTAASGAVWSSTQVYTVGQTVTWQGATYEAQWWTQGNVPGQSQVWAQVSGPTSAWSATAAYSSGDCVMYQGAKYCAKWWTQGNVPSTGGVWVPST